MATQEVALFPDAPMELAGALEVLHRATFGGDLVVGNRIPDPRPAVFGKVLGVGGQRRDLVTDVPTLAVEAWADRRMDAARLAQELRACIHSLAGVTLAGFTVQDVVEFAAPGDLPDPLSNQNRYTATYAIAIRAETSVHFQA